MTPVKKRRRNSTVVDNSEPQQVICSCDDGATTSSSALPLSLKQLEKQLGSSQFYPPPVVTLSTPRRGICLSNTTPRGIKRKCGCIDETTQIVTDLKIESEYHMGPILGRGKFGVVKLCKNRVTGEELACKTLPKNSAQNAYKEVEIMQHLSGHPNIVTLHSAYEDADSLHLVMEICSGGRLVDSMKKRSYSEREAADLIKQLVGVIQHCHEMGVVHRDIKPENVLLTSDGQMKLSDFGLSVHVANAQNLSGLVGSAAYVAPEVLAGKYTEKVDVWATGVLLHTLLIGSLPFCGDSVDAIFEAVKNVQLDFQTEKWNSVSEPAKDLLSKMLSRDVEKRFSPDEVLNHPWVLYYTVSDMDLFKESKLISPYKPDRKQDTDNSSPEERTEKCICRNLQFPLVDLVDHALLSLSEKDSEKQETNIDLVDVLCAAISEMRISKHKKSRLHVTAYPCLGLSPIHSTLALCTAC
ncbi:serine/threonine-protein kinase PEPKR2 [Cryptomeria japonica]|uniref:serine/threonine-protein kinase PEPKR2 n=1 Tax=Cryptomeria japonica TaxID=3369 RepID=UPI0025AC15C5|nr:serine/threonine-protein kinase PEPKR2 [Cryptomeria japonica]